MPTWPDLSWAKAGRRKLNSCLPCGWQEPCYLSHPLLPSSVSISRKLEPAAELGLKPRDPDRDCRRPTQPLNHHVKHPSQIPISDHPSRPLPFPLSVFLLPTSTDWQGWTLLYEASWSPKPENREWWKFWVKIPSQNNYLNINLSFYLALKNSERYGVLKAVK